MLKALHQAAQTLQFLLLPLISLFLKLYLLKLFFPVMRVITRISGKPAFRQFINHIRGTVQEKAVMGNHHNRLFILPHITFQPLTGLHIQMVGGLIQQQDIRFFKQEAD